MTDRGPADGPLAEILPPDFAAPAVPPLPEAARAELAAAVAALEGGSLAVRLANLVGAPIEALRRSLPRQVGRALDAAVSRALAGALTAALRTAPGANPASRLPAAWFHRGLAAASGIAGGALGLPGTLLELPVTTTLLLRQVAAVAEAAGEDLSDPLVGAECLKVFALGGRDPADDGAETGYFATRIALAEALRGAVGRGFGQLLPGFVAAIAARFGAPVAVKLSAQAAPVVGAVAGAAVNLAFLEHFRGVAEGHFTVRRLEREHGAATVRAAYEAILATQAPRPA